MNQSGRRCSTYRRNPRGKPMLSPTNEKYIRAGIVLSTRLIVVVILGFLLTTTLVLAAGTGAGVPWETALTAILDILSGTTARLLAGLMFVGGAILWGFSRNDEGMQMVGRVILAAGLIIGAAAISSTIFGAAI